MYMTIGTKYAIGTQYVVKKCYDIHNNTIDNINFLIIDKPKYFNQNISSYKWANNANNKQTLLMVMNHFGSCGNPTCWLLKNIKPKTNLQMQLLHKPICQSKLN